MKFILKIWRQSGPAEKGRLVTYQAKEISPAMSFLEMLDVVNHELALKGEEPVAFEYDCREGICGSCSLVIDGVPHGPDRVLREGRDLVGLLDGQLLVAADMAERHEHEMP